MRHNPAMTLPRPLPWLGLALFYGAVGCGGLKDERPAKWSYISATIAQPQCATVNCHSAIAKRGDVDLSSADVGFCYSPQAMVPYLKMSIGDDIPRMPPDAPLPAADIELWDAWATQDGTNDAPPSDPMFCRKL